MCTGRGSSDLTLAQMASLYDLNEIVYWKDSGGFWISPDGPEEGIFSVMTREQLRVRGGDKVLDSRVTDFYNGIIRITEPGEIDLGTLIYAEQKAA